MSYQFRAAIGGGVEGVRSEEEFLFKDRKKAMIMTGCNSLTEINTNIFA